MYLIINRSEKFAYGSYEQVDKLSNHHKALACAGHIRILTCVNSRPDLPDQYPQHNVFYEYRPFTLPNGDFRENGELVEIKRLEVNDGPT